jgi:hypothetical protein
MRTHPHRRWRHAARLPVCPLAAPSRARGRGGCGPRGPGELERRSAGGQASGSGVALRDRLLAVVTPHILTSARCRWQQVRRCAVRRAARSRRVSPRRPQLHVTATATGSSSPSSTAPPVTRVDPLSRLSWLGFNKNQTSGDAGARLRLCVHNADPSSSHRRRGPRLVRTMTSSTSTTSRGTWQWTRVGAHATDTAIDGGEIDPHHRAYEQADNPVPVWVRCWNGRITRPSLAPGWTRGHVHAAGESWYWTGLDRVTLNDAWR